MRMIRSLFFGGLAMLAAAMFLTAPARAVDYEPGVSVYSLEWPDIAISFVEVPAIILAKHEAVPKPGADVHAAVYTSQNQPRTSWRFAVDAYARVDPHILSA